MANGPNPFAGHKCSWMGLFFPQMTDEDCPKCGKRLDNGAGGESMWFCIDPPWRGKYSKICPECWRRA